MPLILGILAQGVGAAPGAAGAYDLLETQVLSSSAASVTFTGLGSYSDYKHLQVRATARAVSTSAAILRMRLNSDTGLNYARHALYGDGTGVISNATSSTDTMNAAYIADGDDIFNAFGAAIIDILDFASTTKNKTIRSLTGTSSNRVYLMSGLWIDTSAITSIELFVSSSNLAAGSRFSLYGVK